MHRWGMNQTKEREWNNRNYLPYWLFFFYFSSIAQNMGLLFLLPMVQWSQNGGKFITYSNMVAASRCQVGQFIVSDHTTFIFQYSKFLFYFRLRFDQIGCCQFHPRFIQTLFDFFVERTLDSVALKAFFLVCIETAIIAKLNSYHYLLIGVGWMRKIGANFQNCVAQCTFITSKQATRIHWP